MSEEGSPVAQEPLSSIPPQAFEDFVAALWARLGWTTETTTASGDDGVDIIATRDDPYTQRKLIQVKQRNDPLTRQHAQQYSYLLHKSSVDEVLLVSPAGFTEGAQESAMVANVKLIDSETLSRLIDEADAHDLLEDFVTSEIDISREQREQQRNAGKGNDGMDDEQHARFTDLAESENVYATLTQSIPISYRISPAARLAITLQLFRGDEQYHTLLISEAGDRTTELLDELIDLHRPSAYVNGTTATTGGLIGTYNSAGLVNKGVFTECQNGVVALDRVEELRGQEVLIEPLERQRITVTEANHHQEYDAKVSCLASCNAKYGKFDRYEPIEEQIPLDPEIMELFDARVYVDKDRGNVQVPGNFTELESEEPDHLSTEELVAYATFANQEFREPQLTADARERAKQVIDRWESSDRLDANTSSIHSLYVSAQASSRIRFSETVRVDDIEVARLILSPFGSSSNDGQSSTSQEEAGNSEDQREFDADVIETGTSKTQRDRIKNLRMLIQEIEDEYEQAAPIEEITARASEIGMAESRIEHEIEKLRQRGEVYELSPDHFRTT